MHIMKSTPPKNWKIEGKRKVCRWFEKFIEILLCKVKYCVLVLAKCLSGQDLLRHHHHFQLHHHYYQNKKGRDLVAARISQFSQH